MNKKIILLFCLCLPLFCIAQGSLKRGYDYDAAGNRILRKTIEMDSAVVEPEISFSPPPPSPPVPEYFVEKLDQVQIKIYPNPASEKVTLEIVGWQELKNGVFKLYSLTGQLLQEQPVYSSTTEVSLSGLARGIYILKVYINDETEEWKIIKN